MAETTENPRTHRRPLPLTGVLQNIAGRLTAKTDFKVGLDPILEKSSGQNWIRTNNVRDFQNNPALPKFALLLYANQTRSFLPQLIDHEPTKLGYENDSIFNTYFNDRKFKHLSASGGAVWNSFK